MQTDETHDLVEIIRRQAELFDTDRQAVIGTTLSGEIVYWSETAERMYGWTAAEVEGQSIVEVTPAQASRTHAEEIMERLRMGRSWSGEFLVRTRDGEEFRALVTDVPVKDPQGRLVGLVGVSSRQDG